MDRNTMLFRMGIATWTTDIVTPLPANNAGLGSANFPIGKVLPTDIGFIYGISTYADSIDPDGNALITTTQAQGIYVTLKDGATSFYEDMKLSDFLNEFAGSPVVRPDKYTPTNIPRFDISKSFYSNPNLFVNATIRLKLWYIQENDWNKMKNTFTFESFSKTAVRRT